MPLADSCVVSVERVVHADARTVFEVLANPANHPLLDGSGSVRTEAAGNPERLSKGAHFGMQMRLWVPYRITNVVVEFEDGQRIAWRHFAGHRWRYLLTTVPEGTLVREEWDPTPVPWLVRMYELLDFPERNRRGMQATLDRLEQLVAA